MREYKDYLKELDAIMARMQELYQSLNIDAVRTQLKNLEDETCQDGFWKNLERAAEVNQQVSRLKKRLAPWDAMSQSVRDSRDLLEMAAAENDEALVDEICDKVAQFRHEFDRLETIELLSEEDDGKAAFVTLHPGAGGTESQDWASMLTRMYLRWAEKQGHAVSIIDYTPGEEAGIKSATIHIQGDYSYGMLKSERGIHRLVRISPFDANKRRHTSFASVEVIPEVSEEIDIEISESDLRIDTYRASGAGGQHINTTDSAVRITHIPSGIVVQCQNERSQHKNKAAAMKVLKAKIYEMRKKEMEEKSIEKRGEKKDISWGNQIRSYVFQPYTLVKDHRTNEESGSVEYVLDGDLDRFIYAYLKSLYAN